MLNKLRGVAGVSPCERRFRTCACISIVSSLLCLYTHATAQETRPTQQTEALATVTNLTRPSRAPRPGRREATRDINIRLSRPSTACSFNGTRMSHHAARDARCVPVRFASGAHITRASRRLWATQSTCCSTSAWFRTTCQISVDPCRPMPTRQIPSCTCSVRAHPARGMHVECRGSGWVPHVTTPLSPDRGSPHSHIPHIHTPLPPLPLSEDTKARRPSRPPPTASPGRPPSLPHCERP